MSVTRIGELIQPAWTRTAATIAETTTAASHEAAKLFPALVTPAALIALALGLWRLSADLGWTEEFIISNGFFSHWQVWIALAIALQTAASSLAARARKASEEN